MRKIHRLAFMYGSYLIHSDFGRYRPKVKVLSEPTEEVTSN